MLYDSKNRYKAVSSLNSREKENYILLLPESEWESADASATHWYYDTFRSTSWFTVQSKSMNNSWPEMQEDR